MCFNIENSKEHHTYAPLTSRTVAAEVEQSVRAYASHAEGWVLESQPRQTQVVITGTDNSIAKRSVTGVMSRVLGDD